MTVLEVIFKCSFTSLHIFFLAAQMMLVVGGQAPKAIRSVELYDFKLDKWLHAADMPSRRCRSGPRMSARLLR